MSSLWLILGKWPSRERYVSSSILFAISNQYYLPIYNEFVNVCTGMKSGEDYAKERHCYTWVDNLEMWTGRSICVPSFIFLVDDNTMNRLSWHYCSSYIWNPSAAFRHHIELAVYLTMHLNLWLPSQSLQWCRCLLSWLLSCLNSCEFP